MENLPISPIGELICKMNNILQKPTQENMELTKCLDDFLEELKENQHYLEHGILNIKFAEAGLFLQSAVALYGKKVDLLWDNTLRYQMQLCSYNKADEKNQDENAVLTSRINRNKRKKVVIQDIDLRSSLYDDLNVTCEKATDFLKSATIQNLSEKNNDNGAWSDRISLFSSECGSTISNVKKPICSFRFPMGCQVKDTRTQENLCRYDDLYFNSIIPYTEPVNRGFYSVRDTFMPSVYKHDWLLQRYITKSQVSCHSLWKHGLGMEFEKFVLENRQHRFLPNTTSSTLVGQARTSCPNEFVVRLTRLSEESQIDAAIISAPNTIKKGFERISDADSLFHDEKFHDDDDGDSHNCDKTFLTQRSLADSGICCSEGRALSGLAEANDENDEGGEGDENMFETGSIPAEQQMDEELLVAENIDDVVRNECAAKQVEKDGAEVQGNQICLENTDQNGNCVKKLPNVPPVTNLVVVHKTNLQPMKEAEQQTREPRTLKRKLQKEQVDEEEVVKKKRKPRFRWLKTTSATLHKFERFFKHTYQPEFGEGELSDASDDELPIDSIVEDLISDDLHSISSRTDLEIPPDCTDIVASTEVTSESISPIEIREVNHQNDDCVSINTNSPVYETMENLFDPDEITNNPVVNPCVLGPNGVQESRTQHCTRLRAVAEWKKFIIPKLKNAEHNSKFDIHEYGTRIMNAIPSERNFYFKDLAKGSSCSEVARLFLASLQLANTSNVELVRPKTDQAQLVNDTLEIKLLTRERYHEHLDEYEAPSEHSFRERLAHVAAFQSKMPMHSTPKSRKHGYSRRKT